MFDEVVKVIIEKGPLEARRLYGGTSTYIPVVGDEKVLAERNARIRRLRARRKNPLSIGALMTMFNLSKRQIWNILADEGAT